MTPAESWAAARDKVIDDYGGLRRRHIDDWGDRHVEARVALGRERKILHPALREFNIRPGVVHCHVQQIHVK